MHPPPVRRRKLLQCLLGLSLSPWLGARALAQGIELPVLRPVRRDGELVLEYDVRIQLSRAVEEALGRGVPVHFAARADVYRDRWYWRDERIVRATRSWRLAYQPLTASWRVGLVGGLNQSFATLEEAMLAITRSTQWRLADLSQLDPDGRHYVEFSFRLDDSQLPGPMQIGLGGTAGWSLAVERSVRVE